MSGLSYLEKLLDGAEVEWKVLGDVAKKIYSGGTPDTKKTEYWEGGTFPWMSSGEVNLKTVKETEKYITEAGLNNSSAKLVPKNSVVMALAGQGKTRGKVARTRIALTTNQSLAALTFDEKKINSDYIFHFLETQYESLRQISSGNSGRGGLNLQMISAYKVPVPCPNNPEKSLAIQSEIVRILDAFTALTNELKLRKKQYNYYREQLLSFKEGEVEWKPLGKVLERTKGTKITAGQMKELHKDGAPIKIFAGGKTIAFVNFDDIPEKNINREPSIIVKSRGIIEFEYYDKPFSHKNEMWAYHSNNYAIHIKYIYYFMRVNESYFQKIASKMQMPQIATPDTDKFKVPIPCPDNPEKSLAIQSEIVRILDKFDTLTNSISEGLPREIELRKKQYEHYRNLLFSFPKPVADN
ncbi:TPA: restriction endonuclease subunit S [Salmonella enterica]|uniref:Restriction endonuclease subunit S n=1 Tax=Salmonella enterica TaxID=28901 RepID=A0A765FXC6_SALER|nr:restriction endonuclease subunit S [Salmonella enterica]HAG1897412.1 restriction endonuclease subunit S [Salmonella enterica]HAG2404562.1 restriction endonuclease subunit S [Salmonella enterica]HAG5378524.1 restriction endonuclease subunit S [Salmonella enterica]